MIKQYRHKLNMLTPGIKIIKLVGIVLLCGMILFICNFKTVGYCFFIISAIIVAVLGLLLIIEHHQDKVLNRQAIKKNDEFVQLGINKKSFMLPYKNTEIWAQHLDSMYDHKSDVLDKFIKDSIYIARNSTPSLVIIDLDETLIDSELFDTIVHTYIDAGDYVKKVVFVGLNRYGRDLLKRSIKKYDDRIYFQITCINDYEKAKEWLVL